MEAHEGRETFVAVSALIGWKVSGLLLNVDEFNF